MVFRGRRLLPESDVRAHLETKLARVDLRPDSLIFLPSPLIPLSFELLLERLPSGALVVWIELEPALRRTLVPPDDSRLVEWRSGMSAEDLALPLGRFRRVTEVALTGGRALDPFTYDCRLRELERCLLRHYKNVLTWRELGPRWVSNLLENLPALDGAEPWPAPPRGRIPLVLGAGVGLEDALPLIEAHRDRLWILACDSAVPALVECGLEPDLVACLEAQQHNLYDFVPAAGTGWNLVMDLSAHPAQRSILGGRVLWTLTEFAPIDFLRALAASRPPVLRVPPSGSVGNYALLIAQQLWEGDVLVSGLDFKFPPGKTHARGSAHHRHLLSRSDRLHPIASHAFALPGVKPLENGWRTTPNLEEYLRQFHAHSRGRIFPFDEGALNVARSRFCGQRIWSEHSHGFSAKVVLRDLRSRVLELLEALKRPDPPTRAIRELDLLWFWNPSYPDFEDSPAFRSHLALEARRLLKKI